jgi:hypothetical protein
MKQVIRLSPMTYYNNKKDDDLVILDIERFNPLIDIEYPISIVKHINTIILHCKNYGVFLQKKEDIWFDDFEYKFELNWDTHGYIQGDDQNNLIKFKQQNRILLVSLTNPPDQFILEHLTCYFWKKRQMKLGKL